MHSYILYTWTVFESNCHNLYVFQQNEYIYILYVYIKLITGRKKNKNCEKRYSEGSDGEVKKDYFLNFIKKNNWINQNAFPMNQVGTGAALDIAFHTTLGITQVFCKQ